MAKFTSLAFVLLSCSFLSSCGGNSVTIAPSNQTFQFDFSNGAQGWSAGFANYTAGQEAFFELASGIRPLPAPLDQSRAGFYVSGTSKSAALFMFLKVQVSGLKPNTGYKASFHVEFATNAPSGCAGIGSSPGEGVRVMAGAPSIEPQPILENSANYIMNIDINKDAMVIGNVANGSTDCLNPVYQTKAIDSTSAWSVRTDAEGKLWLLVGTGSGFEGTTSLYYQQFRAALSEQ